MVADTFFSLLRDPAHWGQEFVAWPIQFGIELLIIDRLFHLHERMAKRREEKKRREELDELARESERLGLYDDVDTPTWWANPKRGLDSIEGVPPPKISYTDSMIDTQAVDIEAYTEPRIRKLLGLPPADEAFPVGEGERDE